MAKPTRSPVLGYNHNVRYRGRIFHVQTEDSGPVNPRIFTHLYFGGTILATKKHEYDPTAAEETVRALMQSQHKAILKELKGARHDERITAFFATRGEPLEVEAKRITGDGPALDLDAVSTDGSVHPLMENTPTPVVMPRPPVVVAKPPVVVTPPPRATIFAETFEDEPTTPDHAADMGALAARDKDRTKERERDKDARAPLRAPLVPGWDPPVRDPRGVPAAPPAPVEPMVAGGTQPNRRRIPRVTPAMGGQVVMQRTVPVGGDAPGGGLRPGPRARRPGPSIPYVVKEGSHPLAQPQLDATIDVSEVGDAASLPPAVALTPPPVTPANAPLTSQTASPPPSPADASVEKSLDEVILAYLAQGDGVDS